LKDAPIMQFSGMKDKDGRELWEGDIVKAWERDEKPLVIEFRAGGFGTWNGEQFISYSSGWEVIGNIYQNPELLA